MLELDLARIAGTLPDDDFPRWFVVPRLTSPADQTAWGEALAELVAPAFVEDSSELELNHLRSVFVRAATEAFPDPFDQRLFYLPVGAVEGIIVNLVTIAVDGDEERQLRQRTLIGATDKPIESIEDEEGTEIGVCRFDVTPAQIDEALITPDAKGATLPLTANFWAAHRRVIEGTLVDIVALSVSGDLLISGLAYQAYRELVLNEDLYNG
mgnify:CR=1 FL=1|jgi:hypothetical protein